MPITDAALNSVVRAALAVEMLKDLVEADRDMVLEEARRGRVMPQYIFVLHLEARASGRPVRTLAELINDVDARLASAVDDMRKQLHPHAVTDDEFDTAVRALLREAAN